MRLKSLTVQNCNIKMSEHHKFPVKDNINLSWFCDIKELKYLGDINPITFRNKLPCEYDKYFKSFTVGKIPNIFFGPLGNSLCARC